MSLYGHAAYTVAESWFNSQRRRVGLPPFPICMLFIYAPNKFKKNSLTVGEQIKQLDVLEPGVSSRLAVQLIQALEDAADYHQLGANLQVIIVYFSAGYL